MYMCISGFYSIFVGSVCTRIYRYTMYMYMYIVYIVVGSVHCTLYIQICILCIHTVYQVSTLYILLW